MVVMARINALNVALVLAASVLGLLSITLNANPVPTQDNAISNSLALYYSLGPAESSGGCATLE